MRHGRHVALGVAIALSAWATWAGPAAAADQEELDAKNGSLELRRQCEALTARGQRAEAVTSCTRALETSHSNANVRALVRALVGGPTPPGSRELFQALTLTALERSKAPGQITPIAAACDIAESTGDIVMLRQCTSELERIAPNHPDTRYAEALLEARCPPLRFWGGWLLVLSAAGLTLGHGLSRRARRWRRKGAGVVAASMLLATLPAATSRAASPPAHPSLSKWPVDDAAPESAIPSEKDRDADPLEFGYWLQDVAMKADHASRSRDHAAAVKFYGALALAVPDRAVAFVKMCDEYEAMGDRASAIDACGAALLRDGLVVANYTHFVDLVLAEPGPVSTKRQAALAQVIRHMKDDPASGPATSDVECRVGARTSNVTMLRECTAALAATSPGDAKTISYRWALAVEEGKLDEAAGLARRAEALGVKGEAIEGMQRAMTASARTHRERLFFALLAAALVLGAGAVGARAMRARSI